MLLGADGCSSDPNVEGAKLDLRNKDYDRALQNIEKALESDPQNAEAHYIKGQILNEQAFATEDAAEHTRLLDQMVASYNRAVELDPERASDVENRLRLAYFNEFQRGVQAFNRGQQAADGAGEYSAAAAYFGNAAEIAPDSVDAYMNQAFALINAKRTADAIAPFEMAIEKGDTSVDTYVYLADLYRMNDQPEKAIPVLEQARELHPENADVQAQLLNAYVVSGQADRAVQVYKEAVQNDPSNKLYRYNYGSILLETEDYEGAIEQLGQAVAIDPDYTNAQYNLGAAYINTAVALNDQVSAMDDDLRARRSELSDAQIDEIEAEMDRLAQQRTEMFSKAIPHLEKARMLTDAEGGDATGICQALFQAYAQTGQTEKVEAVSACAGYEDMN